MAMDLGLALILRKFMAARPAPAWTPAGAMEEARIRKTGILSMTAKGFPRVI
jgi:hypothetical protein